MICLITVCKSSCGKVFTRVCQEFCPKEGVCVSGMCAWGTCMAGDVHGKGACVAGGSAWQGGHVWQGCAWGACMVGGHAWQGSVHGGEGGACTAGETATAADGTHPTGMHSCSTNYVSFWWQIPFDSVCNPCLHTQDLEWNFTPHGFSSTLLLQQLQPLFREPLLNDAHSLLTLSTAFCWQVYIHNSWNFVLTWTNINAKKLTDCSSNTRALVETKLVLDRFLCKACFIFNSRLKWLSPFDTIYRSCLSNCKSLGVDRGGMAKRRSNFHRKWRRCYSKLSGEKGYYRLKILF